MRRTCSASKGRRRGPDRRRGVRARRIRQSQRERHEDADGEPARGSQEPRVEHVVAPDRDPPGAPDGGSYTLTFQTNNTRTNNSFSTLNPQTFTTFEIQFTQPILRQAWTGYGLTPTYKAETAKSQAVATRDLSRIDTIQQVYNAYWDLVFTLAEREVARRTLARPSGSSRSIA